LKWSIRTTSVRLSTYFVLGGRDLTHWPAVGDSGAALSPARWLSCGDLEAAEAEPGYHDDGEGHLLGVSTGAAHDGMTSSDPELYSCTGSMSAIHTSQPTATTGPPPRLVNGISLVSSMTSEM